MSFSLPTPGGPVDPPPNPPGWAIFVLPVIIVVLAAVIKACS